MTDSVRVCRHAWLALLILIALPFKLEAVEPAPWPTDEQIKEAFMRFRTWTALYQEKNYLEQYKLVHPRIQKYKNFPSWKKAMRRSQYKNGVLLEYKLVALGAISQEKIPCTEMGHCFRKGMQTVMIVVNSHYEKIGVKEKEYVIMANSEAGWLFGGGTILNLPFGETLGILDRADEKRYEYKGLTN